MQIFINVIIRTRLHIYNVWFPTTMTIYEYGSKD